MASTRPPGTYSPSVRTGRRGGGSGVAGMVRRAGSDALPRRTPRPRSGGRSTSSPRAPRRSSHRPRRGSSSTASTGALWPGRGMRRGDYYRQGSRGWLRLHEKGGGGGTTSQSVDRARERLTGRLLTRRVVLGDDQAPVGRGTASAHDVLPHVPGDGDHGVWGPSSTRSRSRGTRRRRRRSSMTARLTL